AIVAKNRVEMTADAFEAIAHRLSGIRGRKNVVWVSSGFPLMLNSARFGMEPMNAAATRATRAMNDAVVAIYPIDARGLVVNMLPPVTAGQGASTFQLPSGGRNTTTDIPDRPPIVPSRTVNFDSLKTLADDTGGRAFFNSNDISGGVRAAIDDGRLTYVLGYYPTHGNWDGGFREITVKVSRSDASVRHRRGYLALPADAAASATAREEALMTEVRNGLEATGIGLAARISRPESQNDANQRV